MTASPETDAVARRLSQDDTGGRVCPVCELDSDSTLDYCPRDGVRLVDPQRALRSRIGTVIDGRLTLLDFIGNGGMGAVYAARQHALDRLVAVKLVHSRESRDTGDLKRFFAEARAVSRLSHPNVVSVFEFGQTDSGDLFLVMELIEGETLAARLKRDHRLPLTFALRLAEGLCAALQHAHDRGVIHRDVKPANLLLVPGLAPGQDLVKVVDFGVAKLARADSLHSTGTGQAAGTPAYMSPEQALGERADVRSDVYSAAVVLYEVLAGVRPFGGATAQDVVNAHAFEQPPLLRLPDRAPDLPSAVERVILGALSKNPADRPDSPRALLAALQDAVTGARPGRSPVGVETTGVPPRATAPLATPASSASGSPFDPGADWPDVASGTDHDASLSPRDRTRRGIIALAAIALIVGVGVSWSTRDSGASTSKGDAARASGPAATEETETAPRGSEGGTALARRGVETSLVASVAAGRPSALDPAPALPATPAPSTRPTPRPTRPVAAKPTRPERIVE